MTNIQKSAQKTYLQQYQELQLLQTHPTDNFKQYLIKQQSTNTYRMAKKTSLSSTSQKSQDQLLNEITILKELNNPHIIKYHDVFLQQDDFIVILEFCEEGDLEYYVNKKKQKKEFFSEKLILSWVLQILMGLQYIHGKNIIHRLVCSHNIYMNHQGDLKLGSFGGARMLEDTMEKAMTIVGSPCNLSPEVVEGKAYDNKIDIWGLGCLVYELATHQHPFKINSLPELYEMIVKNPPQDLPIKYSKYLNPIYKKMMKKNPAFRPSASQLLQEQVFVKLMSEYTKKKKIDSLDLREVIPKQLLIHKKKNKLPPLPTSNKKDSGNNFGESKIKMKKNSQIRSKSRQRYEKDKDITNGSTTTGSSRLPSLSGKTSESQDEGSTTQKSPKLVPPKQQTQLPSIQKQKRSPPQSHSKQKSSPSPDLIKQSQSHQKQSEKQKQKQKTKQASQHKSPHQQNRLTIPDLMQGQYISLLCQIKLQLLQKKYSPNMSQIFEQTIQFEEEE